MPKCIHCSHQHHTWEPHVPGVSLYYPWADLAVNTDTRDR